jgi:nucleotide-binding universal stress UspA family protein
MPLFPLFPILAIAAQATLAVWLIHMSWIAWIVAPVWIGAGGLIFLFYSRHHTVVTEEEIQVLEEERAPDTAGPGYRVMVAVANPENALQMVRTTHKLCRAKAGRVELLHMVPVPAQTPLEDARDMIWVGKESIVETMLYLAPRFPVSSTIRYCRNIARGIVSAVVEKRANMLIMGWHGAPRRQHFSLGSTIDPIIELTPCDVVILKDCGKQAFKRVLVPVAGGPYGGLALEVASILADKPDGEVVAFTVDTGRRPFNITEFVNEHRERLHVEPDKVTTRGVAARDVTEAILAEAEQYDLIVLGCTRATLLNQFARVAVPEMIAQQCDKPVVMVKAAQGVRSWIKRWI